ncbi:MAG: type III-A CRISPR-associated protein Cas10/Csm1 [Anaerolineales bacterium]
MEEKVVMAALAGLLHDVGKVEQRAKDDPWNPPQDVTDSGQPVHAAWSIRVAQLLPKAYQAAALAGGYHHQPEKSPAQNRFISKLVALADKLSAGERSDLPAEYKTKSPPVQVVSIFDRLSFDGHKRTAEHYLPLAPLSLDVIGKYIESDKKPDPKARDHYDKLRLKLETALKQDSADAETYLENALAAMCEFAWCVPSAFYHSIPDISLYDHSRMTAALAACLVERKPEEIDAWLGAVQRAFSKKPEAGDDTLLNQEAALLVGGDISGVQDFIYTISSKGAAKMLRGRSFYLQLLTEAVLRFVLRRLGLPYASVIYSGGGHFYLLAPLSAQEKLPEIQAEVGKILYRQHGTQLYLVLGAATIPAKGFGAGKLQEYWQKMQNQLTIAKNRRYAEMGKDLFEVFALPEYGGNPDDACTVCGDDSRGASNWDEWEGQSKICPLCRSFAETLGKDLPDTRFLALTFGEPQPSEQKAKTALDILGLFGMKVQFLKDAGGKVEAAPGERIVLWALDDPEDDQWPQTVTPVPRWLRYTANRVPPMTFDGLQKKSGSGFERLGVLRMDVDNLGSLFKDGLGEAFSLSRMAALSSQISLFFEGWLKRIVEAQDWQNLVYTVYSGGDDLFLLAPWDKTPALAQKIVDDFAAYTNHPGLHISGGMAFIDGKYPIYQAAEDAEEAEKLAKDNGRNSFAFLGKAWKWNEFHTLSERKDELVKLVSGESAGERGGPKSILQTLRALAQMEEETRKETGRSVWGRWKWMGAYHLARMEERYKNNAGLKAKIAALREKLGVFEQIEAWGKAARWAQLETRNRSNSD